MRRRCCAPAIRSSRAMQIEGHPVIAVRIERTTSWGNLSVAT